MERQLKTNGTKKTALCSNCGIWISAGEFDRHGGICIEEGPPAATDISEEYPTTISISR